MFPVDANVRIDHFKGMETLAAKIQGISLIL